MARPKSSVADKARRSSDVVTKDERSPAASAEERALEVVEELVEFAEEERGA